MDTIDDRKAVIQPLSRFWHGNKVAGMDMLRLDRIHPIVSGNKWYKLRLNLDHAAEMGCTTVLTFGGGYSNHLVAAAYAANRFGLQSIGVVRGVYEVETPTLAACRQYGMRLVFVTKEQYSKSKEPGGLDMFLQIPEQTFIIPEGGANDYGRNGAGLIRFYVKPHYTHVVTAVGSGTTLCGLRAALPAEQMMLGFTPFKRGSYLKPEIDSHLDSILHDRVALFDRWHFGGFGKWNAELIAFMNAFYEMHQIPLDIIYTGKMMYGLHELLHENYFSVGDRILCIHSGGLQGNTEVSGDLIY